MKLLLVCAGGMSTSLLMRKMQTYWKSRQEPLEIAAAGLADYQDYLDGVDALLVGPQVSYRLASIQESAGDVPCEAISSTDYALGQCENIYEQVCGMIA
jgi:PTS system cellobiose-specific IIB component